MNSTTDALEQRIAALEQQMRHAHSRDRLYRLAALTLGLGLVGVVTVAASMGRDVPGVIQAHRFEVVDDEGIVVVAASAGENGGTLSLWNGEHLNVAMLSANEHGGDLALWSTDGDNILGAFATATGGELAIWNTDGVRSVRTYADDTGGRFEVYDTRHQRPVVAAAAAEHGGRITVGGPTGGVVWEVRATAAGAYTAMSAPDGQVLLTSRATDAGGSLAIHNAAGMAVLTAMADATGSGKLEVSDAAGRQGFVATARDGGGVAEVHGDAARFDLANGSGTVVFSVESVGNTGASLQVSNGEGTRQFLVASRDQGAVINLMNHRGEAVLIAGAADAGLGGALSITNGAGRQVLHAGYDTIGDGMLTVWDATGKKVSTVTPRR